MGVLEKFKGGYSFKMKIGIFIVAWMFTSSCFSISTDLLGLTDSFADLEMKRHFVLSGRSYYDYKSSYYPSFLPSTQDTVAMYINWPLSLISAVFILGTFNRKAKKILDNKNSKSDLSKASNVKSKLRFGSEIIEY